MSKLGELLRTRKDEVLDRWSARVREMSVAEALDEERLRDSLPILLERVGAAADREPPRGEAGSRPAEEVAREHAQQRLEHGYTAYELVVDYVSLREVVAEVLTEGGDSLDTREWLLLNRAIDGALVSTMGHFLETSDRTLRAFERLTTEVTTTRELEPLLERLIGIFFETVPTVETAAILIAEGDRLVLRATRGLEIDKNQGFSLRFGEGFAGTIAATREPLLLRRGAASPVIVSEYLRSRDIRTLYGVPLIQDDRVIGVAHMGSIGGDPSDDDMRLFRGLANRATWAISQAQLVAKLTETAQFREQLLGVVSHDLRTPLNAISLGVAGLARSEELADGSKRIIERIARSAERMRRMIDELLDFTRARLGGGIPITPEPTRLDELCREAVQEIELAHPGRSIDLRTRGDAVGTWDPDRLKQVVSNLVENALVYGAADEPVTITIDGEGQTVTLAVHNGGPAIEPSHIPELFEPFRRVSKSRRGLGLGLFVAAQIVRAHAGTIDLHSTREEGTTVRVRLPREARRTGE